MHVATGPLQIAPLPCASAILIEPVTNTILYEQEPRARRAPASIVKMTHQLVVLREAEAGRLSLEDSVTVSGWASQIGGSQVYLAHGERFTVGQLMEAIAIHSANDACVAVAEHVAGSSSGFVAMMNQEIEGLKLQDTHYVNCHGLDDEPGTGNYTTAYDISQVAREVVRHPQILVWSSKVDAPFRDGEFLLQNTNKLVGKFDGMDGLKTGYTQKAGWCLCATAERNGVRLISVVLGAESERARRETSASLLSSGFAACVPVTACRAGEVLGQVPVRGGKVETIEAQAPRDVTLLISRLDERVLQKEFVPADDIHAPLAPGDSVGRYVVRAGDRVVAEVPAVVTTGVEASGIGAWFRKLVGRA